jgi:hypothetical protein
MGMKLANIPCKVEKWLRRGYAEKVAEALRRRGLLESFPYSYWALVPSNVLVEVSRLLPRCVYRQRHKDSPTVREFVELAREHGNLYFAVNILTRGRSSREDFFIDAVYIPVEEGELIEWAKGYSPEDYGEVKVKGSNYVFFWWD